MVGDKSPGRGLVPPSSPGELSKTQEQILEIIDRRPGASIVRVAGILGFSHSTATYHLNRLVQLGFVIRQRDGRSLRHFRAKAGQHDPTSRLASMMRSEPRRRIIHFLAHERRGCYNINQVARILGEPFSLVKSVVTALNQEGFVDVECINGRYRIQTRELFAQTLAQHEEASVSLHLRGVNTDGEDGKARLTMI